MKRRESRQDVPAETAKHIKSELERNGWSRTRFARMLGVSKQILSQAIGPQRKATPSLIHQMEKLLRPTDGKQAPITLGSYSRDEVVYLEGDWLGYRQEYGNQIDPEIVPHIFQVRWDHHENHLIFKDTNSWAAHAGAVGIGRVPKLEGPGIISFFSQWNGFSRLVNVMEPSNPDRFERLVGGTLSSRPIGNEMIVATGPIVFYKAKTDLSDNEIKDVLKGKAGRENRLVRHHLNIAAASCQAGGWQ